MIVTLVIAKTICSNKSVDICEGVVCRTSIDSSGDAIPDGIASSIHNNILNDVNGTYEKTLDDVVNQSDDKILDIFEL